MLVLTRKEDESVTLIDDRGQTVAELTIVQINSGGRVRVGIKAPNHLKIYRNEILPKAHNPSEVPPQRKAA